MINRKWFSKPNIAILSIKSYFLAFSILQLYFKSILLKFLWKNLIFLLLYI